MALNIISGVWKEMIESNEDKLIRHLKRSDFQTVIEETLALWTLNMDIEQLRKNDKMVAEKHGWTYEEFLTEILRIEDGN